MSSITCTIGKDGKKYFFKDGVRVTSRNAACPSKKETKKPAKKTVREKAKKPVKKTTKEIVKRTTKSTHTKPKRAQKPREPPKNLWLMKMVPIFESVDGKFSEDLPTKKSELIGHFPLKMVRPVSPYELQKDQVEEIRHGDDYWVVDSDDRAKILSSGDSDPRKLKIKNYLNQIWEFGNLKVKGESIPTFIKHVRAYFGPRGPKKEIKSKLPSGKKYVWADYKIHQMMSGIVDARAEWNVEQWNAFLGNMLVNGYILANLHPL